MAILKSRWGQVGATPRIIAIDTDDLLATIVGAGYLNGLQAENNGLSVKDMCAVVTTDAPVAGLYNVVNSGADWTLVAV